MRANGFQNGNPISIMAFQVIEKLHNASSLEEVFPEYNSQAEFYSRKSYGVRKRRDDNVTSFRNALIEYDDISKEEQVKRLLDSGLPILSMTDSGNKSVHAIVRVDASNAKDYKRKVASCTVLLRQNMAVPATLRIRIRQG